MDIVLSFIIKSATFVVFMEGFSHYMENLPGSPLVRMCFVIPFLISVFLIRHKVRQEDTFFECNAAPIMLSCSIWGICEVNCFLHPTKFVVSPL